MLSRILNVSAGTDGRFRQGFHHDRKLIWLVAAPLLAATLTRNPALIAGLILAQRIPWLIENGTAAPGALLRGFLAVQFGPASPFWLNTAAALLLIPVVGPIYICEEIARTRDPAGDERHGTGTSPR